MRLSSGIAPVKHYASKGITVGLGVDGSCVKRFFQSSGGNASALLLSRLAAGDGAQFLTARDVLEMATQQCPTPGAVGDSDALHPGTLRILLQSMQSALK